MDSRQDQGRHRRIWIRWCVCSYQGRIKSQHDCLENATKKVRHVVKTIFSSLESRWDVRVARDHPVCPWVFEWAADLMTRYAHIAQFGEKILYKPLKLYGHHRGNVEDTFLDGIFLGMRLRSDEILIGTTRGVIKTRTVRRRVMKKNTGTLSSPCPIEGEPRQPVPGINSDHVPAAIFGQSRSTLGRRSAGCSSGTTG